MACVDDVPLAIKLPLDHEGPLRRLCVAIVTTFTLGQRDRMLELRLHPTVSGGEEPAPAPTQTKFSPEPPK